MLERPGSVASEHRLPTLGGGASLLVGIDDAPPAPIQIGSPEDGDFRGHEVDLLHEIQRRLGVQLRYRRALWSIVVGELASGKIDVVCSAATITKERMREVDFCCPHLDTSLAVVRRKEDGAGIGIRGARVGVRRGTTAEAHVQLDGNAASIRLSDSNSELYSALANGEIDAVVDDYPIAAYFVRASSGLRFSGIVPGSEGAYAIMVRKGNRGLIDALNAALSGIESDGSLHVIRKRWLGDLTEGCGPLQQ